MATKLYAVAPDTCGSSLRTLLHATILAPRILRLLPDFLKICAPLISRLHLINLKIICWGLLWYLKYLTRDLCCSGMLTQLRLVISCRRFATTYRPHRRLEDGTDKLSRHVGNYRSTLRKIQEERRYNLHCGGNLISRIFNIVGLHALH
jgi:hypothetical protein